MIESELIALQSIKGEIPVNHYHEESTEGLWDKQDSKPLPVDIELDDLK